MTDIELKKIIKEHGTPAFLFDTVALKERMRAIKEIVGEKVHLCYSIKANPFLIDTMLECVEKLEVCSPGELDICKMQQVSCDRIIYSGVNKTRINIDDAIEYDSGVYTAESVLQLELLNESAMEHGKVIPVLLRLNAGSQFGMSKEDLCDAIARRGEYLGIQIVGIHYFAGTQRKKPAEQKAELAMLKALMEELKNVKSNVKPHEILLVVDSMTGQDAVNVAQAFNENLGIDGVVLTKLDGDTRGGAALSVKKVTGRPIKFAATGEKLSDIEVFHPDRMTQRILGMGDVLSIIEKAEETFDLEEAEKLEKQLKKKELDLDDYLAQIKQIKKMGSFSSILKMIPGMNQLKDVNIDDKEFVRIEAMICSMTKEERKNPKVLNGNRRLRIAKGSGTTVQEINKFMKSFEMTQKMMKQMQNNKGGMKKLMNGLNMDDLKNFKI